MQHLTDLGFKQNSLKNLEYHLAAFMHGLSRYARTKKLAKSDDMAEMADIATDVKSSGSKRGTWARKEAREKWTRKNICKKLGAVGLLQKDEGKSQAIVAQDEIALH